MYIEFVVSEVIPQKCSKAPRRLAETDVLFVTPEAVGRNVSLLLNLFFIRQPHFQKSFFVRKSQCQMYHLCRTCAVSLSLLSGLAGAMPHFGLEVSFLCKQAMCS